jgi:hypothetical protein
LRFDGPPAEATSPLTALTLKASCRRREDSHQRERYRIAPKKRRPCVEVDDDHVRASVGGRLLLAG